MVPSITSSRQRSGSGARRSSGPPDARWRSRLALEATLLRRFLSAPPPLPETVSSPEEREAEPDGRGEHSEPTAQPSPIVAAPRSVGLTPSEAVALFSPPPCVQAGAWAGSSFPPRARGGSSSRDGRGSTRLCSTASSRTPTESSSKGGHSADSRQRRRRPGGRRSISRRSTARRR